MVEVAAGGAIAGHRLLAKIGEGHFGDVWRAEYLGQTVALKIFTRQKKRSNLQREAFAQYALGRLGGAEGRYFPLVEHIDLDHEPPYMRMELVQGGPLEDLIGHPALSLEQRLALGAKILEALAVVHRNGFVHGDLSPLNVLVTPDRSVRLIDIGYGALFDESGADLAISRDPDEPLGVASPLYAAPERFQAGFASGDGKPADIFSFGKILYRLITGETPFVIKPVSMKFRALGQAWDDFLFRCLEEHPARRFADASEALEEYRRLYRPQPAQGEFRAECPGCAAKSSIPGGWAGERFSCAGCGLMIEVLFYDEESKHASTAAAPVATAASEIEFLDEAAPPDPAARARKFCPACGQSIYADAKKCRHCKAWVDDVARRIVQKRAPQREGALGPDAPPRSYVLPAVATFFAYFLFWVPGALLNWHYLREAELVRKLTGTRVAGHDALQTLMWIFVHIPLILLGAICVLGGMVAFLHVLFA